MLRAATWEEMRRWSPDEIQFVSEIAEQLRCEDQLWDFQRERVAAHANKKVAKEFVTMLTNVSKGESAVPQIEVERLATLKSGFVLTQ